MDLKHRKAFGGGWGGGWGVRRSPKRQKEIPDLIKKLSCVDLGVRKGRWKILFEEAMEIRLNLLLRVRGEGCVAFVRCGALVGRPSVAGGAGASFS